MEHHAHDYDEHFKNVSVCETGRGGGGGGECSDIQGMKYIWLLLSMDWVLSFVT